MLPDNAYEREGSPALAGPAEPSGAEAVNFGHRGEPPIQQPSPAAQSHCSSADETGSGNGTRKRVRFAAYVPPQQRSAEGIGLAQVWTLTDAYQTKASAADADWHSREECQHCALQYSCRAHAYPQTISGYIACLNVGLTFLLPLAETFSPLFCRAPAASGPRLSSGQGALPVARAAQAHQPCRSMCSTQTGSQCTSWMNP